MRPRLEGEQAVGEPGAEHDLELEAFRLVNRHDLHRVAGAGRGFRVVRRRREHARDRAGEVGEQWLRAVESFVHGLDRLQALDRRAQVGQSLRPLVRRQTQVEQPRHRPVLDEHRVGETGEWQLAGHAEHALSRDHRMVQGPELFVGEKGHEVRLWTGLGRCGLTPGQRIPLRVPRGERVHQAVDDLLQRPASVRRIGSKPAHGPRADAAQARRQRALEGIGVVRPAQRLEIPDQETHDLVAGRRAPSPHLVRQTECAQRLLERRSQGGRAAKHDREVGKAEVRPLRVEALDLARAEERLIDRVALARHHDRRRGGSDLREEDAREPLRLRRHQQALACVERLLRAPAARLEGTGRCTVDRHEVVAQKARDGAAKAVDRLVRIADHDKAGTRLGWRDQAKELELRRVHVLELVDQHQGELRAQPLEQRGVRLQELDGGRDQVAEIDEPGALHSFLVCAVSGREHAQALARARLGGQEQRRRVDEVLLHQRHETQQVLRERLGPAHVLQRPQQLRVDLGQHLAHDDPLLEAVQEQAVPVGGVLAQQARAKAVKRRDPRLAVIVAQPLVDPARDLARRARREREDKDLPAAGHALPDGLFIEVDQSVRLPRARSGQHTKWSLDFLDVEWQKVSRGGAGDLIMRALVARSQPRLLTGRWPRARGRERSRSRATATA